MAINEEGEFELVLGNKQLLSVFFIVVVLLGVFFTMGYIVGRSTAPAATQVASIDPNPGPIVVDPPTASGKPSPVAEPPVTPPAAHPMETAAPPKPEPVKAEPAKPEPPKLEPVKPAPSKPEPVKPPPAKPEPSKPTPAPAPPAGALSAGAYLQVAATKNAEASLLADVLRKKGFPAVTEPVPDSVLIRVMVGPLKDAATIASTRTALEGAGFKSIIKRK